MVACPASQTVMGKQTTGIFRTTMRWRPKSTCTCSGRQWRISASGLTGSASHMQAKTIKMLKLATKPTFVSSKIFNENLVAVHKIK